MAAAAALACGCGLSTSHLQNQVRPHVERVTVDLLGATRAGWTRAISEAMAGWTPGTTLAVVVHGPGADRETLRAAARAVAAAGIPSNRIGFRAVPEGRLAVEVEMRRIIQDLAARGPVDDFWLTRRSVHPDFARATNHNIGAQVSDPGEMNAKTAIGDPNPMSAVGAVERYQKGEVRALQEQTMEAGKAGGD
jgi:hypothetical protein